MTVRNCLLALALALSSVALAPATAQDAAPDEVVILFETGSATVVGEEQAQLDSAARLFRDGNPIVMIITGTADTVGEPSRNLDLSIARARAVAEGLVSRGIPASRLQVLGQGNSELPEVTDDEVSNARNRSARITWR